MVEAIRQVGVRPGDVVFSHGNVGYFGVPEEGRTAQALFDTVLGAFQEALGPEGTLVVPTFTYSFCKRQVFDVDNTPSTCGMFTEMLRKHPDALRSNEPIFSVAAMGGRAREMTEAPPVECFGPGSFWDRLRLADGIICNMNFDAGSTYIHYVERCLNVPYRYDKFFSGVFQKDGEERKGGAIYFCQDLSNADTQAAFEPFHELATERGLAVSAPVGRGALVAIRAKQTYDLIAGEREANPWLTTVAAKTGAKPRLMAPQDTARFDVELPDEASMSQMVDALWMLPRDLVSDGYDAALLALAGQASMTIHEYPTGTHAWSWIVPEKWTCREAYLETMDGQRLFSYEDNPLHVVSYSLPFDGEVSRQELLDHLQTSAKVPGAVPFGFKYYERDWGLCCSEELKATLTDESYRVVIRSEFAFGALKVGEVVVPGATDETIVLCAHLCHPAMVNDDLSGVVVGIDVMRRLAQRQGLRHTYRLLILPETIGSVSYLSHNEALIPSFKGGLFLEMLGLPHPHALQLSFDGDTGVDRCFCAALEQGDPEGWTGEFRSIIGNDERQFNAPGVRVPMLSLSRVLRPDDPMWPYREYHTSEDTPQLCSAESLEASRDLVLQMIDALEETSKEATDYVPVNRFKGEVFCSRYGIHIDHYKNPEGHKALFSIMFLIDGHRSVAQIAEACGISFMAAHETVETLRRHGLVSAR